MKTIIACTDGSPYSLSVYKHAAWSASRLSVAIHVLHVIERPESPVPQDLSGSIGFDASDELMAELVSFEHSQARVARLRGQAILDDAAKQLRTLTGESLEIKMTQRHGSLVETVEKFEEEAALVVIGKRGEHADFAKGHLGSSLERVVRSVSVPVLVSAREFKPLSTFMIVFDGGQSSLKAVDHVITSPLLRGLDCHIIAIGQTDSDLSRALQRATVSLTTAGYSVTAHLLQGDADSVIAEEVNQRSIDLLVMGAWGHSKARQLILGSTTTNLLRTCLVPVLMFR